MAAPQEYTDAFIITKKMLLGGLRGLQSNSKQYETPCTGPDFFDPAMLNSRKESNVPKIKSSS
jgi:hypothetical protein